MKKFHTRYRAGRVLGMLAFAAASLAGCASSETGNSQRPTVTVQLALVGGDATQDGALEFKDADGLPLTVTSARAVVTALDFRLPDALVCGPDGQTSGGYACEVGEGRIKVEGPWFVDLISGEWDPPLETISLPDGTYERVEVEFDDAHDGLVPDTDPLVGNSLVAEGTLPLSGTPQGFQLRVDFSEEARFEGQFVLGPGAMEQPISLALDASTWFSGLPITQCAEDDEFLLEGGTLVLSEGGGACSDLEGQVKEAIRGGGSLDEVEEP